MTPEEVCSYIKKWVQARNTGRIEVNVVNGEITYIYVRYGIEAKKPASPATQGREIDSAQG